MSEDFLSRWSRRKRAVAAEAEAEAEVEADTPPEPTPEEPERSDEEILEDLGLPDPDTLQPGDDVRGFMAKAVPERLRNRALRKLWLTNPVLANLDELVDYGEDFTDAATVIENLQTVYRVGKGMLPDPVEEPEEAEDAGDTVAQARNGGAEEENGLETDVAEGAPIAGTAEDPAPETAMGTSEDHAAIPSGLAQDPEIGAEPSPPRPRRMRFHFETG